MMKIYAHTVFKNEERWLWYSVTSVIDHVDKVLLWDTGSTDKSWEIATLLKQKYGNKIDLKQYGAVTPETFPQVRQEMLSKTDSDWFIVVDGDEVWWEDSIKTLVNTIKKDGTKYESLVVPMIYPIGDIFHRQDESAGKYNLAGHLGHVALRGVKRSIPGLASFNPHGRWGWVDEDNVMIQDRDKSKILFIDAPYMHFSLVPRGKSRQDDKDVPKRDKKLKYEIGNDFPKNYFYPEAFFKDAPEIILSPWQTMSTGFKLRAYIETPLRKVKRRLFKGGIGY